MGVKGAAGESFEENKVLETGGKVSLVHGNRKRNCPSVMGKAGLLSNGLDI